MSSPAIRYVALQNSTPEAEAETLADIYCYILERIRGKETLVADELEEEAEERA